jgi:peroxiredoxin
MNCATMSRTVGALLVGFLWVAASLSFASQAAAQAREGQAVPLVEVALLDGSTLPAQALQGKVVLHVFWATWCHVCIGELPDIQALHDAHAASGFEVVAWSLDRGQTEVEKFWRERGLRLPVAMRTAAIRESFGDLHGTPTFVLADRRGIVRVRRTGAFAPGELERLVVGLL